MSMPSTDKDSSSCIQSRKHSPLSFALDYHCDRDRTLCSISLDARVRRHDCLLSLRRKACRYPESLELRLLLRLGLKALTTGGARPEWAFTYSPRRE